MRRDPLAEKRAAWHPGLCRWCLKKVTAKGRRTFCGPDCIHEWRLRSDAQYARANVFLRDRGICGGCGVDTNLRPVPSPLPRPRSRRLPVDPRFFRNVPFEVDHVLELNEGGDTSLENLQTLCRACHEAKTTAYNSARARRIA